MKKKNSLLEQINIQELESRYKRTTNWLMDNVLSPVRQWDEVCNERAILEIRIYTYYQKNLA
jgi:hypothetical protein